MPAEDGQRIRLPEESATMRLAEDVAAALDPGDLVALSGGLGSGKTTFARAMVRALAGDPTLEVPSPTFPLRIDHQLPRFAVVHADLYRLGSAGELDEIGLEDVLAEGALIVEWPDRLPPALADNRLDVSLAIEGAGRSAEIAGGGTWPARLDRTFLIRVFLDRAGWAGAIRTPIAGDASSRAYERIARRGPPAAAPQAETAILMNAPARRPGPPLHDGRSYDAAAHRALDVQPFVAVATALRAAGVRAPEIYASDLGAGLLLLEDLGAERIVDVAGAPILARYEAAIDLLVAMHCRGWPRELPLPDGSRYQVPPYDREALLVELSLFPDWIGGAGGDPAFPMEKRAEFLAAWSRLLDRLSPAGTLVMRDFHSPNILWQGAAEGIRRVGVIDFQDALVGNPAYDVASLAQDARTAMGEDEEAALTARYIAGRRQADPRFDAEGFKTDYALLALQRATKVLGIFTRLALAEGKPGYQRHRAWLKTLIRRNLAHPVLSELRLWYEPYL